MTAPLNRREFLGTSALAGGMLLAGGVAMRPLQAAEEAGWPKLPPVKVHVVYIGLGGAWPKPEFDAKAEIEKFRPYLDGLQQRLGDVEFTGGELIPNNAAAAEAIVPKLAGADALLLVHLAFGSGQPLLKLIDAGLPTAIFSQPFSGHDWMYVPQWQKAGKPVILAASRDLSDIDRVVASAAGPVPHAPVADPGRRPHRRHRAGLRCGEGQGEIRHGTGPDHRRTAVGGFPGRRCRSGRSRG